jgi:hypothetical protein
MHAFGEGEEMDSSADMVLLGRLTAGMTFNIWISSLRSDSAEPIGGQSGMIVSERRHLRRFQIYSPCHLLPFKVIPMLSNPMKIFPWEACRPSNSVGYQRFA